jgi:excisionase family DNA binding protein
VTIEPQLLRVDEAAAILNIGRTKAYEMAQRGELPGVVRVGHQLRVSRRRLEEWIEVQSGPQLVAVAD